MYTPFDKNYGAGLISIKKAVKTTVFTTHCTTAAAPPLYNRTKRPINYGGTRMLKKESEMKKKLTTKTLFPDSEL